MKLFLFPSIFHQIFYYLPVHQRFAAEKVYLQIPSASGISNQEIQCFFPHFKTHQSSSSMILAFFCKAVLTGKITIMCNMKAQSFYHSLACLKINDGIPVDILCKQLTGFFQFMTLTDGFFYITFRIGTFQFLTNGIAVFPLVKQSDDIVYQIIHNMHCPAVGIQHNVISIIFILMYHYLSPSIINR